jgi:murein DD-endopeptidase MepM/ murein hydrolase activator NlpD
MVQTPEGERYTRVRAVLTSTTMTGQGLLASLRAEATAAATGGGGFVMPRATETIPTAPVELATQTAAVTSAFGWRTDPFSGAASFHRGVDLRGDEGDPVTSTGAGEVVFSGTDGGCGTSIIVKHANGLKHALRASVRGGGERRRSGGGRPGAGVDRPDGKGHGGRTCTTK